MKKIVSASVLILSAIWALNAAQIAINPFPGAFGVDMGSGKYIGILSFDSTQVNDKDIGVNDPSYDPGNGYTNDHMIALGGVWEANEQEAKQEITVSISVSGGDFVFRSQSGEGAARPFGIGIIPKIRAAKEVLHGFRWETEYSETIVSSEAKVIYSDSSVPFSFDNIPEPPRGVKTPWWDIWFDIILVLPYDGMENYTERPVSSTGILRWDGRDYALIQADDYSALVTIDVIASVSGSDSIAIPFSGYYSGNEKGKRDAVANLYVNPRSRAANLSIENDSGNRVGVADMNFMATSGRDAINPVFRIFLSSSNDPGNNQQEAFLLVHEDVVSRQDPKIGRNAIGYDAYLVPNPDNTSGYLDSDTVYSADGSYFQDNTVKFDGKSYMSGNNIEGSYTGVRLVDNSDTGDPVKYYMYDGEIQVEIDDLAGYLLDAGRYTSEIFIHVVDLGV